MLISKLTIKGQATIPAEVRAALQLEPGDAVTFEIKDHRAVIAKAKSFDYVYHKALSDTLVEWNSEEDDEAYRDL